MEIFKELINLGFEKVIEESGYLKFQKSRKLITFTYDRMTIFDLGYHIKYDGKIPNDLEFLKTLIDMTDG